MTWRSDSSGVLARAACYWESRCRSCRILLYRIKPLLGACGLVLYYPPTPAILASASLRRPAGQRRALNLRRRLAGHLICGSG
jgi:hypothetical protein